VAQYAALAALTGGLEATAMMREAFDRRRQTMYSLLSAIPGVRCLEPEGAFYAFPSFEGVLGREIRGRRPASTLELAEILLDEVAVAVVPGEAFGGAGYARLSYALDDSSLAEGLRRITELLAESG
jgi:aspartate/methionine/tyrosine aminotransferase